MRPKGTRNADRNRLRGIDLRGRLRQCLRSGFVTATITTDRQTVNVAVRQCLFRRQKNFSGAGIIQTVALDRVRLDMLPQSQCLDPKSRCLQAVYEV